MREPDRGAPNIEVSRASLRWAASTLAVDVQDRRGGIGQLVRDDAVEGAELRQHLAHVPGPAAGGGLVGHRRGPLHEVVAEQPAETHEQAGDRAVAAHEVLDAARETGGR